MKINIKYFARARVAMGRGGEEITLPPEVTTVAALVAHLTATSAEHRLLFATHQNLKFAVNHRFAEPHQTIDSGDEVAIFPPVTGG
ncbi:MAG: molybdopterin converting factor subunit 1 [Candidatus Pacebacteria bacterium]|nr:molybdopterin converting factor subunit 1 [Candidatus Paceibacterota bacterium]